MYRRNVRWGVRLLLVFIFMVLLLYVSATPIGESTEETLPFISPTEVPLTTATEPSTEVTEPTVEETVPETTVAVEETTIPEETVAETEFVSYYTYTEEELDLLARLIYSEGGTESYETKLKIGSVVMNRVEDDWFPDTIYEVIYQKSQFSVTTIRINGVIMIDRPADEESYRAAKEILDYGSILPSDVQVFYAYYCTEPWVTSRVTYERSDNTIFAYIYGG